MFFNCTQLWLVSLNIGTQMSVSNEFHHCIVPKHPRYRYNINTIPSHNASSCFKVITKGYLLYVPIVTRSKWSILLLSLDLSYGVFIQNFYGMCANSEDYDGFCHLFMVLIEFNLEHTTEHVTKCITIICLSFLVFSETEGHWIVQAIWWNNYAFTWTFRPFMAICYGNFLIRKLIILKHWYKL